MFVNRVGIAVVLGLLLGATARANAADKKAATDAKAAADAKAAKAKPVVDKKSLPAARLEAARAALAGEDDAAAIATAASLGGSGAGNAAEPLAELLAIGAAPARAEAALDALGKLGAEGALTAPRAFEVLDLYSGHHAPEIRQRAVKALGTIKDGRAVPTLLALIKRSDAGAASPLAALATPDLIPQIAELAGTVDDGVLATTLGEYAQRGDVPDRLRLDVVRTIAKLSDASAATALVEYVTSVPTKEDRPSKREAQKLLDQRGAAQ